MVRRLLFLPFALLISGPPVFADSPDDLAKLARELTAGARVAGPVAVLPFEVIGGPAGEGRRLADELTHELVNRTKLTVVERGRIDRVYKEQSLRQTGLVEPSRAARLGRLLSVKQIIVGTLHCGASGARLNARIVDSESGQVLAAARARVRCSGAPTKTPAGTVSTTNGASTETSPAPGTSSAAAAENFSVPDRQTPGGKIEQLQHFRKGSTLYFLGLVKNTGDVILKSPMPTISLLDGAGRQLQAMNCISHRVVFPGESGAFRCIQLKAPKFARFQIHYTPEESVHTTHVRGLKAHNLRFHHKQGGLQGYELTGILKNPGPKRLQYAQVIVLFFAGKNRFIGSATGFAAGKHLAPGAAAPFKVLAFGYQLNGKPTRYEIQFSALDH